jgi:hypothetical protein
VIISLEIKPGSSEYHNYVIYNKLEKWRFCRGHNRFVEDDGGFKEMLIGHDLRRSTN